MFSEAKPTWLQGLKKEKNIHAGFRTVFSTFEKESVVLKLAGSTIYRVFLNGKFIQHGPARGPHGFFRVDKLDLSEWIQAGDNLLAIEVVGYNCHSFAYLNQPSFLQAELEVGGEVITATGGDGFDALRLPDRIQKVERYSFQRPFVEAYRLAPGFDDWRNRLGAEFESVQCAVQADRILLPRGVALSNFKILPTLGTVSCGTIDYVRKPADRSGYWWMNDPRLPKLESFMPEEFERDILQTYQACTFSETSGDVGKNSYRILDMGTNLTGFVRINISCESPVRLMAVFDEVLIDGDIDLDRNETINLVYYELQAGDYALESIDPYTFRYLKLITLEGTVDVHETGLREYANAEASRAGFECSDPDLNLLFEAGRQTFRQNATDLYMDCPGRERAGWLCDSFFTGRVEPVLCGNSKVERNFIENFALPESFGAVPKGMLPMCYPSEHPGGRHIPQWAMWLVLELEEYRQRTGDASLIERMQSKVVGLLDYLKPFENSDGLLEKLPSWNFIEWSKANELTEDVSYPTNMLYAHMLESAARLYGREELAQQAGRIHQVVREQSFNGTFFVDNSVRDASGVLQSTGESTEVCQYYAFFCGTATPETFSNLWNILCEEFGPNRKPGGAYDTVYPANAFIGYYLKMELLSLYGEEVRLLGEIKSYFLNMAKTTGTLWEHCDVRASCNHGFASHLCVHLVRDVLGITSIDPVNKTVSVRMDNRCSLEWCNGKIPVADGWIEVRRKPKGGSPDVEIPAGWRMIEC